MQLKKDPNCSSERGRDWMLECLYIGVTHNPLRLNDNDSLADDAMCLAAAAARMPPVSRHVCGKSFFLPHEINSVYNGGKVFLFSLVFLF